MVNLSNIESLKASEINDSLKVAKKRKVITKKDISGWLLMLPGIVLFSFFLWGPMIMNVILSFFDGYKLTNFQGWGNYYTIFHDQLFIAALENTFKYIFWSLVIGFLLPLILGILLSELIRFKSFFRIGLYIPCVISGVAAAFLFVSLYDPEPYSVLNVIRSWMGLEPSLFVSQADLAIPLIVIAMTWRGAGGTILIYLSAIQNIDPYQYEAVRLDGGGFIKRLRYVTFAHLKPTISTLFIMQIISVFQVFYEPMIIGNSNIHSISLMLLAYDFAFSEGKPELGAAVSVILSLIILFFTAIYFGVTKYFEKRSRT